MAVGIEYNTLWMGPGLVAGAAAFATTIDRTRKHAKVFRAFFFALVIASIIGLAFELADPIIRNTFGTGRMVFASIFCAVLTYAFCSLAVKRLKTYAATRKPD